MSVLINDISEHQGAVDWAAHRAGRQAVILRAHNGRRVDERFDDNRAAAAPMRMVGLYQYLVADRDAAVQAREYVEVVHSLAANEWPILDIEEGTDYGRRAAAWLAVVEPALRRRAWVYSGDNNWQVTDLASAVGDRHRWVARYASRPPITRCSLWQRSSTAKAPGITGRADESIWDGDLAALAAITIGENVALTNAEYDEIQRRIRAELDRAPTPGAKFHDGLVTVLRSEGVSGAAPAARQAAVVAGQAADRAGADVDEAALAQALAPLLTAQVAHLSAEDLAAVATAVADEQARRQAE